MPLFIQRQAGTVGLILTDEESMRMKSKKIRMMDDYVQDIIRQMKETALDWESGRDGETAIAMAAMQVGHYIKALIVRSNPVDKTPDFDVYLNPKIVQAKGAPVEMLEGCLSIPNIYAKVMRPSMIKVKANNLEGQLVSFKCDGMLARVLQHETDHFNGKLFTDYVERKDWIHINDLAKLEKQGNNKLEH